MRTSARGILLEKLLIPIKVEGNPTLSKNHWDLIAQSEPTIPDAIELVPLISVR
jgi:hypothetical protein